MNRLQRYLLSEVAYLAAAAVFLFVFILLAGNALKDILGLLAAGTISFQLFLRLVFMLVPYVVVYALPVGLMTGILLALGRLSAQKEIVAMKAAGMSMFSLATPLLLLAGAGVGLSLWFNLFEGPETRGRYREILSSVFAEDPLRLFEEQTFIRHFPGFVLYLENREGNRLQNLWIWRLDENHRTDLFLRAESATVEFDRAAMEMRLDLRDGSGERRFPLQEGGAHSDTPSYLTFSESSFSLSLDLLMGHHSRPRKVSHLPADELHRLGREAPTREAAFPYRLQIQQNLSLSFSSLSMALLAIPLGIRVGRKETSANLALALLLALAYYFLLLSSGWIAAGLPRLGYLITWLPNIAFIAIALGLLRLSAKH